VDAFHEKQIRATRTIAQRARLDHDIATPIDAQVLGQSPSFAR
jgi:hypothetical protein